MRSLGRVFIVVGLVAGTGCGGGGPASGPATPPPPPPPPPVRTRIPPAPVAYVAGAVSDVPPPVFGSAPYTLVATALGDHDEDGKVDLAWIAATASTSTTHETGSRPGTGAGGFTGDFGGSGVRAAATPFLGVGAVLGAAEEGFVFAVQVTATFVSVSTVGYRVSGANRAEVGGAGSFSGTVAGIAAGDLDGDGIDDVVALDAAGRRVIGYVSQGEVGLDAAVPSALPAGSGATPTALAVGRFHGATAPADVVVALGADGYVLLESEGDGGLVAGDVVPLGGGRSFEALVAGDFDGDGLVDVAGALATPGGPRRVGTLFGRGDGSFEALVPSDVEAVVGAAAWRDLVAADANRDGRSDLLFAIPSLGRAVVLLTDAAGGFGAVTDTDLVGPSSTLSVHDLDGDGELDLVLGGAAALKVRPLLGARN
ncbi:MAG: VCBS repeat-containing protein [Planctomycetota bacterium]